MRHVVRRREVTRVLQGEDSRMSSDFPGSPEYLLLEALKTATIIVQYCREVFNALDKTIPAGTKEWKQSFDIRDLGEAILGIDKALVESINAKREQSAIKLAPIKREGVIFSDYQISEVKNSDNLWETAQDYFRLQADVRSFDLKRPSSHQFVFQSINSYTYVALRELISVMERVYDECGDIVPQLVQYCEMMFSKLIPELEHSFFHCKLDSTSLRIEIEVLKQHCDGISWAQNSNFEDLLKQHKNDLIRQMVDKLILCMNQSIERVAVLIVMHPINNSENLTPIGCLLWNVSTNLLRPVLYYVEKIKFQVGNQNAENKVVNNRDSGGTNDQRDSQNAQDNAADKRGFSYACDKIITEHISANPEKPSAGLHITRDRRSSDATVSKPSYVTGDNDVPSSPRRDRHLSGRRERVNSSDQGKAQPLPPKLNFSKLPAIEEEFEADHQSEDPKSNQTKSLTRSGKLAGLFSVSPRKNSRGQPDFSQTNDGDVPPEQVQLLTTTTLARGSISPDIREIRSTDGEVAVGAIPQNTSDGDDIIELKPEDLDEAAAMLNEMIGNLGQ